MLSTKAQMECGKTSRRRETKESLSQYAGKSGGGGQETLCVLDPCGSQLSQLGKAGKGAEEQELEFCWVARDRRSPAPARVQAGPRLPCPHVARLRGFQGRVRERTPRQKLGLCCVGAEGLEDLVRCAVETLN